MARPPSTPSRSSAGRPPSRGCCWSAAQTSMPATRCRCSLRDTSNRPDPLCHSGLNVLQTALFEETITSETVELARLLLDHGADPQPVCTRAADGTLLDDWSALHLAILASDRVASDRGAEGTSLDDWGAVNMAIMISEGEYDGISHDGYDDAACGEISEVVELLLDHGCGVDTPGEDGWTALHAAAGQAQPAIVRALLARGADRRARSSTGNTPLHALAFGGLPDSIVPSRLKCSERTVLVAELLLNRDRPKSDQLSD
eukprot:m.184149 g.184149  ORF g.184149 m.184149 type:complete len:259 (-) comp10001_c0_seq56:385-1161(-)